MASFAGSFGALSGAQRPMQGMQSMQGGFGGDPALIQTQANINQALAFAEQEAMREMRQLLIDYGDPELAAKYLNEPNSERDVWKLYNNTLGSGERTGGRFGTQDAYMQHLNQMANPKPHGNYPMVKNQWGTWDWDPAVGTPNPSGNNLTQQQKELAAKAQADIARIQAGAQGQFFTSEAEAMAALQRLGAPQIQGWGSSYNWMSPQTDQRAQGWNVERVHEGRGIDVEAADKNPYSVLKRLARQSKNEQFDANENLNKSNLWYSSERGRVLNELGTDAQGRSYDAARSVQQQLDAIQAQLQQSQNEAQQALAAATLEAQQKKNQGILSKAGG